MRAISFNILRRRSRIFAIEFAAAAVDQRSVYRRDPAYEARSRGLAAHGGEHEEARAGESRADLRAWVEWATEATDVFAQFIAIAPITTAGACHQQQREGYGSCDDNKPVLHGS